MLEKAPSIETKMQNKITNHPIFGTQCNQSKQRNVYFERFKFVNTMHPIFIEFLALSYIEYGKMETIHIAIAQIPATTIASSL